MTRHVNIQHYVGVNMRGSKAKISRIHITTPGKTAILWSNGMLFIFQRIFCASVKISRHVLSAKSVIVLSWLDERGAINQHQNQSAHTSSDS